MPLIIPRVQYYPKKKFCYVSINFCSDKIEVDEVTVDEVQ